MRWSLVVVRRLKMRIGDRIDIGVEFVGQNPRGVTMEIDSAPPGRFAAADSPKPARFTAVYLRESAKQPAMPFKTLIMANAANEGVACLTLRSATAEYTVRLKEPIEEQDDFVWVPYEVLERRGADHLAPDQAEDARASQRIEARLPPLADDIGTPTDWMIPQLGKRTGTSA